MHCGALFFYCSIAIVTLSYIIFAQAMQNSKAKQEGFLGQKMFVLPPAIRDELVAHSVGHLLYITDIGFFPKARHHNRERTEGAAEHILIFCIEGKGTVTIRDEKIPLSPNEFCLIEKEVPHAYFSDVNNPWSIYWIHFSGEKADDVCSTIPVHNSISLRADEHSGRMAMFNDFFQVLEQGITKDKVLYISMQLWALLSSFAFNDLYADDKEYKQNRIEESIAYMKQCIKGQLTLEEIADCVQVSASHFSSVFKNSTGYSPLNFFILLKMQEACRLLSFTSQSIKQVAFDLGYADPYYFSRLFKKTIGKSPSEYRSGNS